MNRIREKFESERHMTQRLMGVSYAWTILKTVPALVITCRDVSHDQDGHMTKYNYMTKYELPRTLLGEA